MYIQYDKICRERGDGDGGMLRAAFLGATPGDDETVKMYGLFASIILVSNPGYIQREGEHHHTLVCRGTREPGVSGLCLTRQCLRRA